MGLLVLFSGMFSGLTIGLSSLSKDELRIIEAKNNEESKMATKVLSVLDDYNLLLVTLLLGNTVVNSILTDLAGKVVGTGAFAIMTATTLILLFGEITPAAVLTKHALKVGSKTVPLIRLLIFLFYPVGKPVSWVLNKFLGKNLPNLYTKNDFKYIIHQHEHSEDSDIDEQDSRILKGVLSMSNLIVAKKMTKKNNIFSLEYDTLIDNGILDKIRIEAYTRIPVTKDNVVIGIINSKTLIGLDKELENKKTALDIMRADKYLTFNAMDKLDDVLEDMIQNKIHIGVVMHKNVWVGLISMEDIIETMFQKEIFDESDDDELFNVI